MTQRLEPLFGEAVNSDAVARAAGLPAGVYEGLEPAIAGAGPWTVTLGVDATSGLSRWRGLGASGSGTKGNPVVREDAAIQVAIAAPSTQPRIDLIVGYYKWVQGPTNATTGKPTGVQTSDMNAVYTVIQGTPSASPVAPVPPDPDGSGRRPIILAQVTVPTSGAAVVSRWDATDFRLPYMRAVTAEVVTARGTYANLKARLDALNAVQQIETMSIRGATPNTGGGNFQTITGYTTTKQYGSAVTPRTSSTFGLAKPGLYEIKMFHKVENQATANTMISAVRAYLVYNGGTPELIDNQEDTPDTEVTEILYAQVYVDPAWTDPYVYFVRDGVPAGYIRGSIDYLGTPDTLAPLAIVTGNQTFSESASQTFPDSVDIPLVAQNGVGAITWAVITSAGDQDGATDPAATIGADGQTLHFAWTADPTATLPKTWTVKLQATDSAGTPRTVQKDITITLNPYSVAALTITSTDKSFTTSSYPYNATFTAQATGGVGAYTWALVGGGTTLPGATINASTGVVSSSVSTPATYTVELQCTDSATPTPSVVTKTLNVAVATSTSGGGGGGGGCVPAGTFFGAYTGDIPVEQVRVGTLVRAYDEDTLEPVVAQVVELQVYEDRPLFRLVTDKGELVASGDHRACAPSVRTGPWQPGYPRIEDLEPGMVVKWETAPGVVEDATVLQVKALGITATVYHVTLDRGHVFVAGGLLAHNIKTPY